MVDIVKKKIRLAADGLSLVHLLKKNTIFSRKSRKLSNLYPNISWRYLRSRECWPGLVACFGMANMNMFF
jgi:hypothetical protein